MHSEGGEKSVIEMDDGRGAWGDFFLGSKEAGSLVGRKSGRAEYTLCYNQDLNFEAIRVK